MKALFAALSLLIAVTEVAQAYDTHNCPVEPLICDVTAHSILGGADCTNAFTVPVHLFSFVGTAGEVVSLFLNLYPYDDPIISLYGPGDATPAATTGVLNFGTSTVSIDSFRLTRDGPWTVVVTALDKLAVYIAHADFTLTMTCRSCANPPEIIQQPTPTTIAPGMSATLAATFGGTDQPTTIQWFEGYDDSQPIPQANAAMYTTAPLYVSTVFHVSGTNDCGKASSILTRVNVVAPPRHRSAKH